MRSDNFQLTTHNSHLKTKQPNTAKQPPATAASSPNQCIHPLSDARQRLHPHRPEGAQVVPLHGRPCRTRARLIELRDDQVRTVRRGDEHRSVLDVLLGAHKLHAHRRVQHREVLRGRRSKVSAKLQI
eukprot:11180519-Alexandrium_andersonii.AAC.1